MRPFSVILVLATTGLMVAGLKNSDACAKQSPVISMNEAQNVYGQGSYWPCWWFEQVWCPDGSREKAKCENNIPSQSGVSCLSLASECPICDKKDAQACKGSTLGWYSCSERTLEPPDDTCGKIHQPGTTTCQRDAALIGCECTGVPTTTDCHGKQIVEMSGGDCEATGA